MSPLPIDLGELRRQVRNRAVPVLMDAADAAVVLDISVHAVLERFDNMVMAGDRYLVRAEEVRGALPAPVSRPVAALACLSCGEPLPTGARRFCSPRCARLTPSGRARLLEGKGANAGSENPRQTAVIS
jgi:hypothetical protein